MSAFEQPWKTLTGVPAVDFEGKRYTAINYTTGGKVTTAAAAGHIIGIIQEPNDVDEPALVTAQGFSFAIFGGAVAAGDTLEVGTGGKLVKATSGVVVGIAPNAVLAADDIGTVLLK